MHIAYTTKWSAWSTYHTLINQGAWSTQPPLVHTWSTNRSLIVLFLLGWWLIRAWLGLDCFFLLDWSSVNALIAWSRPIKHWSIPDQVPILTQRVGVIKLWSSMTKGNHWSYIDHTLITHWSHIDQSMCNQCDHAIHPTNHTLVTVTWSKACLIIAWSKNYISNFPMIKLYLPWSSTDQGLHWLVLIKPILLALDQSM